MSVQMSIVGASGATAEVTPNNELVVGPVSYDETVFKELAGTQIAGNTYNFYEPKAGKQFVITLIVAYGDKQVGTSTNATVKVYEATDTDDLVPDKILVQFEIGQNQSLVLPALRLLVNPGVWINATTTDDDIHMTIMGHYIKELP